MTNAERPGSLSCCASAAGAASARWLDAMPGKPTGQRNSETLQDICDLDLTYLQATRTCRGGSGKKRRQIYVEMVESNP
jgi:hypothetical protein